MGDCVSADRHEWRTRLLVIQPTPFCNINCSYCYLPHRNSRMKLSFALAEQLFERLFAYPTIKDTVTVVWHAGEPMVLPVDYYEAMFSLIQRRAGATLKVGHSFQTNGTLITDAWCDLIEKWDVNVGVSIDGPAEFHDLHRKYRNGAGSFERAFRGVRLLQAHGVPFHVISVLTVPSLQAPEKMLAFYDEAGIDHVCFNIEETEGCHSRSGTLGSACFSELYRRYLETFFELAMRRNNRIEVREFERSADAIRNCGKRLANDQTDPFAIISVDCEGNLSTFSPELLGAQHPTYGSFCFGNAAEDDFETIATRVIESRLYMDIVSGRRKCRNECAYFGVCGGGAPSNKIFENGSADSTETGYCRSHQIAIDVVLSLIERLPQEQQRTAT